MGFDFRRNLQGFKHLAVLNAKHYALAAWGIGLRLDPDYPEEARFRGDLIVDAVLEYRGYGLFVPWLALLARFTVLSYPWAAGILATSWAFLAWKRAYHYSTPFRFWTQAFNEAPTKARNQTRYAEEIMLEIERQLKHGADYNGPEVQELLAAGLDVQELIVSGGKHENRRTTN